MRIARRSLRMAGFAGCAAVVLGLSVAGSPAAHAAPGITIPVPNPNAAVSWGANGDGELGDGSTAGRDVPGPVSGLTSGVLQVAAGWSHNLAITSGGVVWAWGWNGFGQLGDGTLAERTTPVQVAGLSGVRQVAGGFEHSLALRSDGTVWAWGANHNGELGNGVFSDTPQPTPVQVFGLTGVTKIAAGFDYSVALRSDGTVWAWGDGDSGELGDGQANQSSIPVQVTGLSQVTSISVGWDAAYAIRTTSAGPTLWAWGANFSGDLGDGTQAEHDTPEQVTGVPGIVQVSAGGQFAIALASDGSVWGWGGDDWGQFGNTPTHALVTHPIKTLAAGSGITQLSAGQSHVLALTSGGGVLAWGLNSDGELGNGNNAAIVGPVHVTGLSGASQVAAGTNCSFAVYKQPQGTA